jgi:hypothetical protein
LAGALCCAMVPEYRRYMGHDDVGGPVVHYFRDAHEKWVAAGIVNGC